MICLDCRNGYHEVCQGATHCPCQHRVPTIEVPLKSGGVLTLRATTENENDLPVEVADAIDRILAHPELLVKRDRPKRKTLTELVTNGTYTTEAEVTKAALVELTQLAEEMGLE